MKTFLAQNLAILLLALSAFADVKENTLQDSSSIDVTWSVDLSSKKVRCKIESRGTAAISIRPQIQILRRIPEANPQVPPQKEEGIIYPFVEIVIGSDSEGSKVNFNFGNPPEVIKIAVGETKVYEENFTAYFKDAPNDLKKIKSIRAGILLNGKVIDSKKFTYADGASK